MYITHKAVTGASARTVGNNKQQLTRWAADCTILGDPIRSITPEMISSYVNNASSGSTMSTRLTQLACIRGMFKWLKFKHHLTDDPASEVSVNHRVLPTFMKVVTHKSVMDDDQFGKLINRAHTKAVNSAAEPGSFTRGFFYVALVIGRDCGLRLGDICNLTVEQINMAEMTIKVFTSKGATIIDVPMTERVLMAIMWYLEGLDLNANATTYPDGSAGHLLFPTEARRANSTTSRSTLSVAFNRFFREVLGTNKFSFHSLRATYATTLAKSGASMTAIAAALGHSSTGVTASYVRDSDSPIENRR